MGAAAEAPARGRLRPRGRALPGLRRLPARALDLAQKDAAARPYGTAQIALGWAWLANNRPAEALKAIAPLQGSAWVTAEQHLVAAQAHALLGEESAADAEQQKARAGPEPRKPSTAPGR